MKAKEENRGKEEELSKKKELLSEEELLEVAAGRGSTNLSPGQSPEEIKLEECMTHCLNAFRGGINDRGVCEQRCKNSNSVFF